MAQSSPRAMVLSMSTFSLVPSIKMARQFERTAAQLLDHTAASGTVSYGTPFGSYLRLHPAMFGVCCTTMPGSAKWDADRRPTLRRAA